MVTDYDAIKNYEQLWQNTVLKTNPAFWLLSSLHGR